MESRGLSWLWINLQPSRTVTSNVPGSNEKAVQDAISSYARTDDNRPDIVILENYIVADGRGGFYCCMLVYDMNCVNRRPGDGIRFHDGGSYLAAKPLNP